MNFDEKAKTWDNDPKRAERAVSFADEIKKVLGAPGNLKALEVGTGTGLVSFALTDFFSSITLADSSEGMISVLKGKIENEKVTNMHPFLVKEQGDLMKLEDFDVIYTLLTLHHIRDISFTFCEFSSVLKKGGHVFIGDLITEDGSFHFRDPDFDGHKGFDPEEMKKLLLNNGFGNVSWHIFHKIEREQNGINKIYPMFFISAIKL